MNQQLYSLSVALNQIFTNSGPPHNPPRWIKCAKAAANAIPMEVSRVYISKYLNDEIIRSAFAVVARVHHALRDLLQNVPWMQDDTRKKAVEKVMKMRTEVAIPSDSSEALLEYGFQVTPHYYTNAFHASNAKIRLLLTALCHPKQPASSRVHWSMAPTEANSYYDPTLNTLFITAAMLSPPFFDMQCAATSNVPPRAFVSYPTIVGTAFRVCTVGWDGLLGTRRVMVSIIPATSAPAFPSATAVGH
jgi:predicted metalloendopeptidase